MLWPSTPGHPIQAGQPQILLCLTSRCQPRAIQCRAHCAVARQVEAGDGGRCAALGWEGAGLHLGPAPCCRFWGSSPLGPWAGAVNLLNSIVCAMQSPRSCDDCMAWTADAQLLVWRPAAALQAMHLA